VSAVAARLHLLEETEQPIRSILSSPKSTSFQHYLVQPSDRKDTLVHYQNREHATLRGYKLYWHKDKEVIKESIHDQVAGEKLRTEYRPVDTGVTFVFRIYFENLSDVEIGALLWILRIASDEKYAFKVGMAKPLGLGSVTISHTLHTESRHQRYRTFIGDEVNMNAEDDTVPDEINTTEDEDQYIHAFQAFIISQLGNANANFELLPRIQTFLSMLQRKPGLAPRDTGYMALSEFRYRPVLPTPNAVINVSNSRRADSDRAGHGQSRPKKPKGDKDRNTKPTSPNSPSDIEPGMLLKGTVERIEHNRLLIDVGVEQASMSFALLPKEQFTDIDTEAVADILPIGTSVLVEANKRNRRKNLQVRFVRKLSS